MLSRYAIARADRYLLIGAKAPQSALAGDFAADSDGLIHVDLLIDRGRIAAITPAGAREVDGVIPQLPLGGAIVLPLFVDAHTHLDKGHIWRRASNADGTFDSALETVKADRETNWSAKDVAARMEFSLRCAYAHGTSAIRTHIDSVGAQTEISWPVFASARERWRERIDLQASPLFSVEYAFDEAHMTRIEAALNEYGSKILGAVAYDIPRLREALEILFALAERKGYELDFHVDETLDPSANALHIIAEIAIERRFARPILAGHCCSLGVQPKDDAKRTIDLVAKAGINVVSLPMCNLYLQDRRADLTPGRRGVTALHELKAAGVRVLIASDNTRDPFYAYGDLDMLEVWREGVRILHLDHPTGPWAPVVLSAPAEALNMKEHGALSLGAPADMILTKARSFTELFARPQADRTILRNGAVLTARPPSYEELDSLQGLRP
jgi:cytosine/creatinine deaminase